MVMAKGCHKCHWQAQKVPCLMRKWPRRCVIMMTATSGNDDCDERATDLRLLLAYGNYVRKSAGSLQT